MYSQTKRKISQQSGLLFIVLFVINFNSLRSQSNALRNDKNQIESSITNSSCIDCLNRPIKLNQNLNQLNSTDLIQTRSSNIVNQTTIKAANSVRFISRLSTPSQMNYFSRRQGHAIAYRSTPNLVLLSDSGLETGRRQSNNRKKQLDLEFDQQSINLKSNLNYNLDDSPSDHNDRTSTESNKQQNIDRLSSEFNSSLKFVAENQDHKVVEEKQSQNTQQESVIIDQQQSIKLIDVTNRSQINTEEARNQYKTNDTRIKRPNEQLINRRPINPRQNSIQSSYSILRKFHPINQINQLSNMNRYTIEDARLATLEIVKVQKEGRCKLPSKRTISISKLVLSNNLHLKKIMPHCTILHRCEPDTGCCSSDSEHCTVKKQETVRLPFWVIELNSDGQQFKTIEWFSFMNHTECGCETKS